MHTDSEATNEPSERSTLKTQIYRRLNAQVDTKWGDLILLGCFYCSGLVDSMAFNMYGCFVSMQTGNTIFIGLGVNGQPESLPRSSWSKSLAAVGCFALGALFFSTFHRICGPQKRWVLLLNFAIQALLVAIVAIIVTIPAVPTQPPGEIDTKNSEIITFTQPSSFPASDFGPITILAFQSAGQIVASRMLKYNAMPTVVLTSLYCDLMSDAQLFTAPLTGNGDRNRRVLGALFLLVGAISGAFLTKSDAGFRGGLWIACFIKALMAFSWFLWKQKPAAKS